MAIIKKLFPDLKTEFSPWERGKAIAILEMEMDLFLKDIPKSRRVIVETKVYLKPYKKKKKK